MADLNGHRVDPMSAKPALDLRGLARSIPAAQVETNDAREALDAVAAQLEAEIAVAMDRTRAANDPGVEINNTLRAVVAASKQQLDKMECEHERQIAKIRAAAQAEVERILADASRLVGVRPPATDPSPSTDAQVTDAG